MANDFQYDVFLSHSAKDKAIVRPIAERLRADGLRVWLDEWILKPGDNIPSKIEEGLEQSRVLVLCMSKNAFGSDWATLETQTFRFRDPLNKDRRFLPLRLDEVLLKGSLAQLLYISWQADDREPEYGKLLEACQPPAEPPPAAEEEAHEQVAETAIQLDQTGEIWDYVFSPDGKCALSGSDDNMVRLWDLETGKCLRVFEGHTDEVNCVAWSADQQYALSGSDDNTVRLWDVETGQCLHVLKGHKNCVDSVAFSLDRKRVLSGSDDSTIRLWDVETGQCQRVLESYMGTVWSVAWSTDQHRTLSGSWDKTVRLWDVETGKCLRVFEGHTDEVNCVAWSADQQYTLSGSDDNTVRLWDVETGKCLRVFEGHTDEVDSVTWSMDQQYALSGSDDKTVRLWDVETGQCLHVLEGHVDEVQRVVWSIDQQCALSGDAKGGIRMWDLSKFVTTVRIPEVTTPTLSSIPEQVEYTNAKVLLVGDTSSGKTGLAHRLATGEWKPSDGSTVGAWSTQWKLPDVVAKQGLEQDIWLWDFGGQADQRLIHQLYMDRTALILLLFDADKEDVLPGLRDWQMALRRCIPLNTPQFLVAGRIDVGFKANKTKLRSFAEENSFSYYETSAQEGWGCEELRGAILNTIPWDDIEKRTSPRIFKRIKEEVLQLRDEGQVLLTFKELREMLRQRLHTEEPFTEATLLTVIGLLDGPGAVKELDYGTYILLQPEWINAYAQAVIRTLRQDPSELGSLPLRSIAEGQLIFQTVSRDGGIEEMKRLPEPEERVVLREMERQLEEHSLCLRQGDKLVFPSHCGRDRPAIVKHPSVFVSYTVEGYLDDIYATLVVKLADCEAFKLKELWRDAADFVTLAGDHHMGIKLSREAAGNGEISIYFAPGVTQKEQVIFANYIHAHLENRSEKAQRLRHYVCPSCHTPKGNSEVLMKKVETKGEEAAVICDNCDKPFNLWDDLEKLFASVELRAKVKGMQADDVIRLDTRRKGKLLALEVAARISSADQKCFEIPGTEDEGIDMELEFTDDNGQGTGKRLYLQLKSGNSYLKTRKTDGAEIFAIKEPRWVEYWMQQQDPVMLVIGTFPDEEARFMGKDKLEFSEVRWMEISSYLRRESDNGKKPVKQIVFTGERLDLTSVRRWRDKTLNQRTSIT